MGVDRVSCTVQDGRWRMVKLFESYHAWHGPHQRPTVEAEANCS